MNTLGSQGLTVTPIYWAPPGSANQFPGNYEALINGYLANVATASSGNTNVYSIDTEYYDIFGGQLNNIRYHITAGSPIVDTRPLPPNHCRQADGGYDTCILDTQLQTELNAVLTARHLPRGLAYFYPVFFPPGVQTQDAPGSNSGSTYCAYHANVGTGANLIVYGNEPYTELNGCTSGQSPNHNAAADAAIDDLSHELNEATTDPEYQPGTAAWQDHTSYEIGDICSYYYGTPLGSTDPSSAQTTEYNQVINGGRYYTQNEFSNYAYNHFGVGMGCWPSESAARSSSPPTSSTVAHIFSNPSPNRLSANGRARSSVFFEEWDKTGTDIPGDRVFFTTYVLSGHGDCGKMSPRASATDGAGSVSATYRASRSNVMCAIVATEALDGKSVVATIYQGKTRSLAPRASLAASTTVTAARRSSFTTTFTNPMRRRIADAQVSFYVFAPDPRSPNVRAGQIHVSVSWHGRRGPFVPVALTGSTGQAGIVGVIGGAAGFNFRARHKLTLSYRIRVSPSVPRGRRRPVLQLEAFLDQVNPGSGADDVLADTGPKNVKVR